MTAIPTYRRVDVCVEQGAKCRFWQVIARVERPIDVVEPGEEGVGDGRDQRDDPDEGDDAHGPLEAGHGVRVERVANGQVALHREGDDRQHGRIRCPKMKKNIYRYGQIRGDTFKI